MMWFKSQEQRRRERMTPGQMREEAERAARYAAEQLQRKPTKVEVFARAYCTELGYDPDAKWFPGPMMPGLPMWKRFRDIAERELHYQATAAGFEAVEAAGEK